VLIIAFFLRERSEQVEDERVNVPAGVPEGGRGLTQIKAPSARIAFMATWLLLSIAAQTRASVFRL
jgi:hypothetical protein